MKIEFVLEFDNYIEYHGYRPQRRESRVGGIIAFLGFGLLALGYTLLRLGCKSVVAGVVLFAGLGTTALSVPIAMSLRLWRRKDVKRSEAMLRSEFERLYVGPREFEADESGWRFRFKQAQDCRAWGDLSWFREETQTLIISDGLSVYMLPKSALKLDELERLRELCVQAFAAQDEICSVPLATTVGDVLSAAFPHNWRKHLRTMLTLYGVGLICVAFLWVVLTDAWPFLKFPAAIFLPLLLPCAEWLYYWWHFQNGGWKTQFQTASISADVIVLLGGTLQTATSAFKVACSRVLEVQETGRVFVIYELSDLLYIVPKSGIPLEKMDEIRNLLFSLGKPKAV